MGWVYRRGEEHGCELPVIRDSDFNYIRPDGNEDDLWFCEVCGKYWRVSIDRFIGGEYGFWHHLYGTDLDNALLALGLTKEIVVADNRTEPTG